MSNELKIDEILKFLPHRYPFLLVDRVTSFEPFTKISAYKNLTFNELFFQGHFPAKAVMPGVLIVEAMAQTAGILAYKSTDTSPKEALFYLAAVNESRFKRKVIPGDRLTFDVEITKRKSKVWKFKSVASVDGEAACTAEMTCMEGGVDD